jgi:hypothetical protein
VEFTDIKAPGPVEGTPPWRDPLWLAAAEEWLEAGHPRAAVERSLVLALRIAPLARALAWGRLFPCFIGHPGPVGHAARVLAWLLDADPLGPGD